MSNKESAELLKQALDELWQHVGSAGIEYFSVVVLPPDEEKGEGHLIIQREMRHATFMNVVDRVLDIEKDLIKKKEGDE